MKKDYSEYKHTDYEKYNIARQSNSYEIGRAHV